MFQFYWVIVLIVHIFQNYITGTWAITRLSQYIWITLQNVRITSIHKNFDHYDDVMMESMASQITSLTIVYSTVYSGADQRKHQSSTSLAFVQGIHLGSLNSPHKWPVTRKVFPFDDVIMYNSNKLKHTTSMGHIDSTVPLCHFLTQSGKNKYIHKISHSSIWSKTHNKETSV